MKFTTDPANIYNLSIALGEALYESLKNPGQVEPQLVANLVFNLPDRINRVPFSGGFSVKTGGVFVHAQPFVRYSGFTATSTTVELGDLLLLRTGMKGGVVTDRQALLLQAKKCKRFPVSRIDRNQHHLYAQWPEFEYVRSPSLNGEIRHIQGMDIYSGAKYLLIGQNNKCLCCSPCCGKRICFSGGPATKCVFTAHPSEPDLNHYRCFFDEMYNFILGDAGKAYEIPFPPVTNGWDRVIDDLTKMTSKMKSAYMRRASSGGSRTRGVSLCFMVGDLPAVSRLSEAGIGGGGDDGEDDGPPEVPSQWYGEDREEGGISTVEFVVESDGEIRD